MPGLALSLGLRTSLTRRVTLAFVLLGLAILVGVAALAFYSGRANLQEATVAGLTAVAIEKEARLDSWFVQKASQIEVLAVSPFLATGMSSLLDPRAEPAELEGARERLNELLARVWLRTGGTFSSVFALDVATGKILAATNRRDIGKFKEDRPYFIHGKGGVYVQGPYYSLPEGGPSIVFAAPIKTTDGHILGVIAGRPNIAELQAIIERSAYDRTTDDNFIVNKAGLFVTQPRYIAERAPLRFGTQSDYVKHCLAGNSGVALTDDYRSVPVIAIYRWIGTRQFCLVAKADQAEVLAPINVFRNSILLTGVVVLAIASATAIGLGRSITRPITALRAGAERLGRGERDVALSEGAQDELGVLAREFNRMAKSLGVQEAELRRRADDLQAVNVKLGEANAALSQENAERRRAEDQVRVLNEELEQRVAARTAELSAVNRELESFFRRLGAGGQARHRRVRWHGSVRPGSPALGVIAQRHTRTLALASRVAPQSQSRPEFS
jgi:C4-dicarboxylate-specific signal transduction histidine kinase